jgi:hypothetical protein
MATRDFHSKYFTDWKYLIISDLSSLSDKNNQSELKITVTVGGNAGCGSHGGGFDAFYMDKKIEVYFEHNPNKANPIEHPIKVFDNKGNEIKDWWDFLCPDFPPEPPASISITGQKIDIIGHWQDEKTFKANEINVISVSRTH